jgi:hypothetical protein
MRLRQTPVATLATLCFSNDTAEALSTSASLQRALLRRRRCQNGLDLGERDWSAVPAIDADVHDAVVDGPLLVNVATQRDIVRTGCFWSNVAAPLLVVGSVRRCWRIVVEPELSPLDLYDNVLVDVIEPDVEHRLRIGVVITADQRDPTVECREVPGPRGSIAHRKVTEISDVIVGSNRLCHRQRSSANRRIAHQTCIATDVTTAFNHE